jgi:hypothetical protein
MTVAASAFWIYLAAYANLSGVAALVLGLIGRFTARPFDTPIQLRVFLGLSVIAVVIGVIAALLSYQLASEGGGPTSLKVSAIGPLLTTVVIFLWASGFPLSRIRRTGR